MLNQAALVWRRTDRYLPRTVTPELFPDIDLVHWAGAVDVAFRLKDLLILALALLCTVGVYAFLRSTRLGRMLRACADSPNLAQLCGVNRDHAIRWVFVLGGGLAGGAAWVMGLEAGSLLDVRGLSFLSFGLALYVTVLIRARASAD